MSKVIVVKELLLNYDYAGVLEKNYIPEELSKLSLSLLKRCLEAADEDVKYVCLLGDLFEEDTLMVDEIDEFIEMIGNFPDFLFVIAPLADLDTSSWYNIVNWPENAHLLTQDDKFYKDHENEVVLYYGEPETTIFDLDYHMVNLDTMMKQEFSTFLPRVYTVDENPSYCIATIESGHIELISQDDLRLKSIILELSGSETIDDMVDMIHDAKEECRTFYQIIIKGMIKKELANDLDDLLQENLSEDMDCVIYNQGFKNYDVESIMKSNKENLIGIFIKNVEDGDMAEDEKRRIIETGLDYML